MFMKIFFALICGTLCVRASEVLEYEAENFIVSPKYCRIVDAKQYSKGKAVLINPSESNKAVIKVSLSWPQRRSTLYIKGYIESDKKMPLYVSFDGGRKIKIKISPRKGNFTSQMKLAFRKKKVALEIYAPKESIIIDNIKVISSRFKHKKRILKVPESWSKAPFVPPVGHPRVLLNKQYIDELKKRIDKYTLYKKAMSKIKRLASAKDAGALPSDKKYRKGTIHAIKCQAFVYAINGTKEYSQKAISNLIAQLNEIIIPYRHDVCRDYGELIFTAALVYDWCFPELSSTNKTEIVAGIRKLAKNLEIGWPPVLQSSVGSHAGEAQLLRDLLAAGIAVYDTDPKIYDISASRFFSEMVPARNFYFKSHRHPQGSFYGPYRFSWDVWAATLFKRMNNSNVFSNNMGKVPYAWVYSLLPDGQTFRDGDGDKTNPPIKDMGITALYKDPYLKYKSLMLGADNFALSRPILFMLFNDPDIQAKPFNELPWTKFFPEPLGSMIARSGWNMGLDSNVAVVEMKGAGYMFNGHQHLDAGAFQIYYKGYLASDGGAYRGYGTPFDWSYNKRSISHNTMLAYSPDENFAKGDNDGGQRQIHRYNEPVNLKKLKESGYRNGKILAHALGPDKLRPFYSYLKADLTLAYNSKKIERYTRTFCFINFARDNYPGALIVLDKMTCRKPSVKKFWLLQSVSKPTVNQNKVIIIRTDDNNHGKLVNTTLLPSIGNYKVELIGGSGKENWVFNYNYPVRNTTKLCNGWRTQISPIKQQKSNIFLNIIQIMDADKKEVPVKKNEQKDILVVEIRNWLVVFPKDDKMVKNEFIITPPLEGKVKQVLLTGLKPGFWNINNQYRIFTSASSGSIYLEINTTEKITLIPNASSSLPIKTFSSLPPEETADMPRAVVNGKKIALKSFVKIKKEIWIPAEPVLKAVGVKVIYKNKKFVAINGHRKLKAWAGKNTTYLNGNRIYLRKRAFDIDGLLYLPVKNIASYIRMIASISPGSKCVMFKPYPKTRFKYPWYEQVNASTEEDEYPAINACDGDATTYWCAHGHNARLVLDMGKTKEICGLRILWLYGGRRKAFFNVSLSDNRKEYTNVYNGKSSGRASGYEIYKFPLTKARYIKLTCNGNSINEYNSLCEIEVITKKQYGAKEQ